MIIGVPRETFPGERRVALTPPIVGQLVAAKLEVRVERAAGESAGFPDAGYQEKGAVLGGRDEVFLADVLLQVRTTGSDGEARRADLARLRDGQVVIGLAD